MKSSMGRPAQRGAVRGIPLSQISGRGVVQGRNPMSFPTSKALAKAQARGGGGCLPSSFYATGAVSTDGSTWTYGQQPPSWVIAQAAPSGALPQVMGDLKNTLYWVQGVTSGLTSRRPAAHISVKSWQRPQ